MEAAALLEALVRIPSVTQHEQDAVRFLQEQARADGLRVIEDGVGNFIAEAGSGPRRLLFVGHIDTVPGHIPVTMRDGELWGRGSVDAKGPLVAAYCAARRHVGSSQVAVRVVGAVGEEGDSRGAKALQAWDADWIVVGEPSGHHAVTIGYKGVARGSFRLERAHGHGAHPGPTAVEDAMALWTDLGRTLGLEDRFEALQGHLLALESQSDGLTDQVAGRFQLRLPPEETPLRVATRVEAIAQLHGASIEWDELVPAAVASQRTDLVAAFRTAIRSQGGEARLLRKTGTADFNLLHQRVPRTPIVAYGPGDARLDHTPQERLRLSELHVAIEVLDHVVGRLAARAAPAPGPGTFTPPLATVMP
jgi:LysW-gamma-L-lysine carboxypeptidase